VSAPPNSAPGPRPRRAAGEWAALLTFPLLALALLWPALFAGQAIAPVGSLAGFSPWKELTGVSAGQLPQWNVLHWDGIAQFYPWRLELTRALGEGRLPLWNPWAFCGTPFLANSQSAPLYPPHWLLALPLGSLAARMAWLAALHLTLAGGFTYALARGYGLRAGAALTAGAAFQLSGYAVAWLPLPSFISVACWIPAAVLLLSGSLRRRSLAWAAGAGGAIGLMLLAGHLQVALYGLLTLGAVWAAEAVRSRRFLPAVGLGSVALGLGLGLAAAQLLPAMELSRVSHRVTEVSEAGYAGYTSLALPPQNWVTLLAPDFYGLPGTGSFWGYWNYQAPNTVEYAGHVGAAALLLALIGLALGGRISRMAWLWAAVAAGSLLLAAGTPLNRVLYFGLPGFAQSGSPARSLILFCLAQALLAGFGVEALLRRSERRWSAALPPLGLSLVGVVALAAAAYVLAERALPGTLGPRAALLADISQPALVRALAYAGLAAGLPALLAWLLRDNPAPQRAATLAAAALATVAGGLLWVSGPLIPLGPAGDLYPETALTTALARSGARVATTNRAWSLTDHAAAVLPPNASLAYGWRDAQGYDSLALAPYRRLAGGVGAALGEADAAPAANGNMLFLKDPRSPLLRVMGARYGVSLAPVPDLPSAAGFPAGPPFVYDLGDGGEAYTAGRWHTLDDGAALEKLRGGAWPLEAVIAPGSQAPQVRPELLPARPHPAARVERPAPGRVVVTAAPPDPALLVLAEAHAPGWRARVQERGRPAREGVIVRANVGFQGVFVGSGPVRVEWSYQPTSFRGGLFLSLLALALTLALVGRRRSPGF
jgi:hypothetical protein